MEKLQNSAMLRNQDLFDTIVRITGHYPTEDEMSEITSVISGNEHFIRGLKLNPRYITDQEILDAFKFEDESNAKPTRPLKRIQAYNELQRARYEGAIRARNIIFKDGLLR